MSDSKETIENPLEKVQSHDWNRERLQQLKQLMPDLFTNEGNLNINELKKVVDPESVSETERYEFRWFGKSKAKREAFTPTDATLVYDEDRSVNPENSENLIIEGENLQVLKLLSKSYREQVKCIYIDPPYNKDKDFVYRDTWKQDVKSYWEDSEMTENGVSIDTNSETDGRFHSNWLNMMYSRLLIARQLLKEDGVLFISLDDSEIHHLRKLCDDIFGEENFIECITWNKRIPKNDKGIGNIHEYILLYVKNSGVKHEFTMKKGGIEEINRLLFKLKKQKKPIAQAEKEIKRLYKKRDFDRGITLYNSLNADYRLWGKINMSWPNADTFGPNYTVKHPKTGKPVKVPDRGWRWKRDTFNEAANFVDGKYQDITELHDGSFLCGRIWFSNDENTQPSSITYFDEVQRFLLRSILSTKSDGGIEIEKLFEGKSFFSYPKPSRLIKLLFDSIPINKGDIFLDFFAGSGTTGQAIQELNEEDGLIRNYILVQFPEAAEEKSEAFKAGYKKLSDITIERNKRIVEKIITQKKKEEADLFSENKEKQELLKGLGFKVFKLVKSNFPRVEYAPDPEKSEEENLALLKKYITEKEAQLVSAFNREELITEILIKNGFKLNYILEKQEQFKENEIFMASDGEKETLICLDISLAEETVGYFKTNTDQKLIVLERALDTTKKWNLKHYLGDKFNAF
ncbi:site-specific DNA-methyltransferase [Salegentibacter sp. F188]|uniref:site-specific DNA-methyltransferase (adenine-specific) n=1 Tax=Autumnicola patrickiae TaxID=3075591 RepID=A0ABU3E6C6_9FLAO|nr:site-specific DNA-methyltransferase [Salegentibacter sp. F188]MDT0691472.1 site-specific DNA-methyltransferase [Salegentibacter sp. F188]